MMIRQATDADIPALQHLYDEHAALLAQANAAGRPAGMAPKLTEQNRVWVGEVEGAIGGYICAIRDDDGWLVDDMALDAHVYYPGMARALVGAVQQAARAEGQHKMVVRVPLYHPVEQAFWRALGAQPAGRPRVPAYEWMQIGL